MTWFVTKKARLDELARVEEEFERYLKGENK